MFQKATKVNKKLRLSIQGAAGSGKTYSALAIASGLCGDKRIAFIDTEHGSASLYANLFDFDVMEMEAPYSPSKFIEAVKSAGEAGYGVVIVDSLTHAWNGEGGLLDIVNEIAVRKYRGNTFTAWNDATPIQKSLVEAFITSPIHVIVTMRSKMEYTLDKDDKGKSTPRKVGMAPEQRNDIPYEFDAVFEMDTDNNAIVSKTRFPELNGRVFKKPGKDVSSIILASLGSNSVLPEQTKPQLVGYPSDWKTPADAQKWAVDNGYCKNEFEAKSSFKNSLKEVTGQDAKLDANHLSAVLQNFYSKHVNRKSEVKVMDDFKQAA